MKFLAQILPALIAPVAVSCTLAAARAADAPVIDTVLDATTSAVLWQSPGLPNPSMLKPGQAIILRGHGFGSGPVTAAAPGLSPPAGGAPPGDGARSLIASPPEPADHDLSKVLFGNVRALERNLSSYQARIDLESAASAVLSRIQGGALDYFVEDYARAPDTWVADISAWSDTEIDLNVPITAYEGPITIVRLVPSGETVTDIRNGQPLRYRDPITARVIDAQQNAAFVDGWQILRTGPTALASNAVPVTVAVDGKDRMRIVPPVVPGRAGTPTGRSVADQFSYGERAFWAWDWNLALPHFLLGVDWNGIFGQSYQEGNSFIQTFIENLKYQAAGIDRPSIETDGYSMPMLAADGTVREMVQHRAMIDRMTGTGIRPFTGFGAIPLLPEPGADRLIAPDVAFDPQRFTAQTPYPIEMALRLPLTKPLYEGQTQPTGWVGYVRAEAADPLPGHAGTRSWIGFNCAACHAARVSYEYAPGGKRVTQVFPGIPNPDWKPSFLALSGRTFGLALEEKLPATFIRFDYPAGTQARLGEQWKVRIARLLDKRGLIDSDTVDKDLLEHSKEPIDKTLLLYNVPPGATESTMFVPAGSTGDYGNDYFFSPQAMPIITNHTPARRALSRSELMAGFEGAYLHGEEPEGARGPMSSRSLQDLTLYVSTLRQSDELLRRIGMYRWLSYREMLRLLGGTQDQPVDEGTFVSFLYPPDELSQPTHFPPTASPGSGLGHIRDAAIADPSGARALAEPFAMRFPALARRIVVGSQEFRSSCARCHAAGNAGMWTNEDMQPISAAGGSEPVGRFFSPTAWQRSVQSIRTAILENLFWVQRRGLLSDGHIVGDAPNNMAGLEMLVDPDRCKAPLRPDGSVDLEHASALYRRLYTVHQGAAHSFRIPGAGMRFEYLTRFGEPPEVLRQVVAAQPDRQVSEAEGRFVERHAYFIKLDDGYYYWDYQKMRREYGVLEFGLDPADPAQQARIGGLPAAPHPWCLPDGSSREAIDDLVAFLLTL
jgi:hypothetical protein